MNDFLAAAWHLRYILAGVTFLAWLAIRLASRANDRYIERHVAAALDEPTDMTWTDEALGRVLRALDDTFETDVLHDIDAITQGDRPTW